MFDKIKKAFVKDPTGRAEEGAPDGATPAEVVRWAREQGFSVAAQSGGFALEGELAGKPCRIELGRPSRNYIQGDELRARADLGINPDVMMVLLNRPLKDALVKQAYARYTDTLQTSVDAQLSEEMRLLAMYDEVGWEGLPRVFWSRYSLVADERGHGTAWVDEPLAEQLLDWPVPGPSADMPFMLMLLRGKAYLRMQQSAADAATLRHAVDVFCAACENARRAFPAA